MSCHSSGKTQARFVGPVCLSSARRALCCDCVVLGQLTQGIPELSLQNSHMPLPLLPCTTTLPLTTEAGLVTSYNGVCTPPIAREERQWGQGELSTSACPSWSWKAHIRSLEH